MKIFLQRYTMKLEFTKMHGIGNDYIYLNCPDGAPEDPAALAIKLSDRHRSVGGNGLVLILPSDKADFRMRMFNSDGSEGAMCGNAIRCVGKYVYDNKMTDKTKLSIETASGIKTLQLHLQNGKVELITVDMGAPVIAHAELSLRVGKTEYKGLSISMGNPHFVTFCEDVPHQPVTTDGPFIEHMSCFPDRTNVEFAEVMGEHLRMRVWERGSGETQACGTGACATAVASVVRGFFPKGKDIDVHLPGGVLTVNFDGDTVYMTGAAETVFHGTIEIGE